MCLMLAISVHALVLLGVTFGFSLKPPDHLVETLEIVLVNWRSETEPEDPDYLAQVSQRGGGDAEEKSAPSQRQSGEYPTVQEGDAPAPSTPALPQPEFESRELIVVESETADLPVEDNQVEQTETPLPSAAQLLRQSMEMASLQPDFNRNTQDQSQLPRREFISANTRSYKFASYMSAWVAKVERVGNLNYPTKLRQQKLHGDLVLTVGIDWNGTVESVEIMRSSGIRAIDDAAVDIVKLAGPYSALSDNIRETVDILHITRTWRFEAAFGVN